MLCLCYSSYLRASFSLLSRTLLISPHRSLEAFARICVSGFLFDPEISLTSLLRSPFQGQSESYPTSPAGPPHSAAIARSGSLSQGPLQRGNTITKKLSKLTSTLLRPFTLAPTTSPYPNLPPASQVTLTNDNPPTNFVADKMHTAQQVHGALRDTKPTFFSNALRSDKSDVISLPFQLSITQIKDKAHRNIPYLRQSWTRIDFIAIVSFWIMFALAMTGVERGAHHIGVFRAMSVIRTARLLSITSGTTVSLLAMCFGCLVSLLLYTDHYAFFENCSTTPDQSSLFCPFCDGALFVRVFFPPFWPPYSCNSP